MERLLRLHNLLHRSELPQPHTHSSLNLNPDLQVSGILAGAFIAYGGLLAVSVGGSIPGEPCSFLSVLISSLITLDRNRSHDTLQNTQHTHNFTGIAASNPGLQKLIIGLVFPVGLFLVQLCGAELCTGNTAFVSVSHELLALRAVTGCVVAAGHKAYDLASTDQRALAHTLASASCVLRSQLPSLKARPLSLRS